MRKNHGFRNGLLVLIILIIVAVPTYLMISNYEKNQPKLQYTFSSERLNNSRTFPDTEFAVMSDIHLYDNSLGITGSAFEACLNSDRKLLKDSSDLLDLAIDNIKKSKVKFVLITGDLTKDGEMICHQKVADKLSELVQNNIKVYVIPGNHDVNNPGAFKYEGDKAIPVSNITPKQFAEIYKNCGYGTAIYRDANSLSYVAEPDKNLWLVALDTCRYQDNVPGKEETIGGRLTKSQEKWLEDILSKAKQNGKAVFVMEHHGVVEHWTGQSKLHPDYLVQDYKYVGKLLASFGVNIVFTGHYHAQDVTMADFGQFGKLYDIETGSLITSPCPVRFCTIAGNKLNITSQDLVSELHPNTQFAADAEKFVSSNIEREAYNTLKKYLVPENDAHYVAKYVSAAFVAHYKGDENETDRPAFDEKKLSFWGRIIFSTQKYAIDGLWKDLPPQDNELTIDLPKK